MSESKVGQGQRDAAVGTLLIAVEEAFVMLTSDGYGLQPVEAAALIDATVELTTARTLYHVRQSDLSDPEAYKTNRDFQLLALRGPMAFKAAEAFYHAMVELQSRELLLQDAVQEQMRLFQGASTLGAKQGRLAALREFLRRSLP